MDLPPLFEKKGYEPEKYLPCETEASKHDGKIYKIVAGFSYFGFFGYSEMITPEGYQFSREELDDVIQFASENGATGSRMSNDDMNLRYVTGDILFKEDQVSMCISTRRTRPHEGGETEKRRMVLHKEQFPAMLTVSTFFMIGGCINGNAI